jgi:hypothetical protein
MVAVRGIAWEAYLAVLYKVRHYIRTQQNGIQNHWKALLRILGYVSRTINHGITYGGNKEHAGVEGSNIDYYYIDHNIEGHMGTASLQDGQAFSDIDYATDPRDRKSILGIVFMVYEGAVMTYSKKMKSVARSTTEAEYVGMGEATKARCHRQLYL